MRLIRRSGARTLPCLVFLIGKLDIIIKFVVGGRLGKKIGGAVLTAETVQRVALQSCDFMNDEDAEPVLDKLVFLVFDQPLLKGQHAAVLLKRKHIDDRVEIQARTAGAVG